MEVAMEVDSSVVALEVVVSVVDMEVGVGAMDSGVLMVLEPWDTGDREDPGI